MAADILLTERAPAKINLTLHILSRRADGWHELESLVAFSRGGDLLQLAPGGPLSLKIEGPTATASGDLGQNLVLKATRNLQTHLPDLTLGAFHLIKRLPVAAGIGGGSSDAAAALRLLARANGLGLEHPALLQAAIETGADVPVCLMRRARMMTGFGERLGPLLKLPPLIGLLVNPGQPVETKAVFQRMNIGLGEATGFGPHPDFNKTQESEGFLSGLKKGRNDMEPAACLIAPIVSDVLAVLGAAPGCKLARMSGSGATCFALFANCKMAAKAKKTILRAHPNWWVKTSVLS
jgi:4-diphosphocytidyl-2-C-methyl-D-erythritol kinase